MVTLLGGLAFKIRSLGIDKAASQFGKMDSAFSKMSKQMGPQLKRLNAGFSGLAKVAGGAFAIMLAASPLLRARMEILSFRVSELVRIFADELAPILEFVTKLVENATKFWNQLPKPLQDAVMFGVGVVAVLGAIAIALIAVNAAISPVTIAIIALIAILAALHLAWTQNLGGFQDAVKTFVGNIVKIFSGFVDFFKNIFTGNLSGAWDALKNIFEAGVENIIIWITAIPKAVIGIIDYLTGGALSNIIKAGQEFFEAFLRGIWDSVKSIPILGDLLQLVMDFFGGSLPERGPLVKIPEAGQEVGKAYIENIGIGLDKGGGISKVINRNYRIDNIELSLPNSSLEKTSRFMSSLDSSIRRVTQW